MHRIKRLKLAVSLTPEDKLEIYGDEYSCGKVNEDFSYEYPAYGPFDSLKDYNPHVNPTGKQIKALLDKGYGCIPDKKSSTGYINLFGEEIKCTE